MIKKDDYAISSANRLDELLNPPPIAAAEDLFFVDAANAKLYLRLVSISPADVFLVDGLRRITLLAPYIEVKGLTIEYGYEGLKPTWTISTEDPRHNADHTRIINNTIRHVAGQGILSGEDYLLIDGNDISFAGCPLKRYQDTLEKNNLDHAMYLTGSYGIVRNNSMRNCHGQCMHPWSSDYSYPRNFQIYNNHIEGGLVATGQNHLIRDNDISQADGIAVVLYPSSNITLKGNVIRGENALMFGDYGVATGVTFTDNFVSAAGYCLYPSNIDVASATLDRNTYQGCQLFSLATNPAHYFSSFESYQTFMTENYNQEANSSAVP